MTATNFTKTANRAVSILASGMDASQTSLTLATGDGNAKFPATFPFPLTAENERMRCTARTNDVCTVVRQQYGTTAAAHSAGVVVEINLISQYISEIQDAVNALETAGAGAPMGRAADYVIATADLTHAVGADAVLPGTGNDQAMIAAALALYDTVMVIGGIATFNAKLSILDGKTFIQRNTAIKPYSASVDLIEVQHGGSHSDLFFDTSDFAYSGKCYTMTGATVPDGAWAKSRLGKISCFQGWAHTATGTAIHLYSYGLGTAIVDVVFPEVRVIGYYNKGVYVRVVNAASDGGTEQAFINGITFLSVVMHSVYNPFYLENDETIKDLYAWASLCGTKFLNCWIQASPNGHAGAVLTEHVVNQTDNGIRDTVVEGHLFDFEVGYGSVVNLDPWCTATVDLTCTKSDWIGLGMYSVPNNELAGSRLVNRYIGNDSYTGLPIGDNEFNPHHSEIEAITGGEAIPAWNVVYLHDITSNIAYWRKASNTVEATARGPLRLCRYPLGTGTITNGTATCTGSPVTLVSGVNTIVVTSKGAGPTGTLFINIGGYATLSGCGVDKANAYVGTTIIKVNTTGNLTITYTPVLTGTGIKRGWAYNPAWNWDLTKNIYLGTSGGLTQTAPTAGSTCTRIVAHPLSPTSLDWLGNDNPYYTIHA